MDRFSIRAIPYFDFLLKSKRIERRANAFYLSGIFSEMEIKIQLIASNNTRQKLAAITVTINTMKTAHDDEIEGFIALLMQCFIVRGCILMVLKARGGKVFFIIKITCLTKAAFKGRENPFYAMMKLPLSASFLLAELHRKGEKILRTQRDM